MVYLFGDCVFLLHLEITIQYLHLFILYPEKPCLVECCKLKGLEIVLLVNISAVGFVYNNLINLRNVSPRLYLGSRSKSCFHSILSNAWLACTDNIAVSLALFFSTVHLKLS